MITELTAQVEQLKRERDEALACANRLEKIPYTKTRDEFMESWGVEGMPAGKKRLVNAAWDRAEWFFNQRTAELKAQWQAEAITEFVNTVVLEDEKTVNDANYMWDVGDVKDFSIEYIQRLQEAGNE